MRRNRTIWGLLLFYTIVIVALQYLRPKPIDWTPTYDIDSEIPFASKLVFEYLKASSDQEVRRLNYSWADSIHLLPEKGNLVIIGEAGVPDRIEQKVMMEWVANGGTILFSNRFFPSFIEDSIGIKIKYGLPSVEGDSTLLFDSYEGLFWEGLPALDTPLFYTGYQRESLGFSEELNCQVHSKTIEGDPVLVTMEWGEGQIILHSVPRVFTNFHFAERQKAKYILQVFDLLNDGPILWDQYRSGVEEIPENRSILRVLDKHTALKTAWYISCGLGFLYLFWMGKRRQRAVPQIEPKKNRSLEFAEQLGDLYFKQSDARSILMKRVKAFQVFCMEEYGVQVTDFSEQEKIELAQKMGVEDSKLDKLWASVPFIRQNRHIAEERLIYYNKIFNQAMIQQFRV